MNTVYHTSIPAMLVESRGNQTEVSRKLGIRRETVKVYAYDQECKNHIILHRGNGLEFFRSNRGGR